MEAGCGPVLPRLLTAHRVQHREGGLLTELDGGATGTMSGKELMSEGLPKALKTRPGATLITDRRN